MCDLHKGYIYGWPWLTVITPPVGIVEGGGGVGESLGFDCFPLRIVGIVFETWVVSLGFRNSLPFLVFVCTILLEYEWSSSLGCL